MEVVYICVFVYFFFECYGDHRDLHVLTHSFPTRRSSDLSAGLGSAVSSADPAELRRELHRAHRFPRGGSQGVRSEEHTSELQSLMRKSYAVFCLKKKHPSTSAYIHYLAIYISVVKLSQQ